mmetsp:Transcript_29695/g.90881  ORF Transcript_29695/g.90881 Transcript_29695/m.90881 type:complete len:203 (-) Transcript_29695:235-843(-)
MTSLFPSMRHDRTRRSEGKSQIEQERELGAFCSISRLWARLRGGGPGGAEPLPEFGDARGGVGRVAAATATANGRSRRRRLVGCCRVPAAADRGRDGTSDALDVMEAFLEGGRGARFFGGGAVVGDLGGELEHDGFGQSAALPRLQDAVEADGVGEEDHEGLGDVEDEAAGVVDLALFQDGVRRQHQRLDRRVRRRARRPPE